MPVMLHARDEADWLNVQFALEMVHTLLVPFPTDLRILIDVSPSVNSPVHNMPNLRHPVSEMQSAP
jgi:putative SOS response-associated peptidase YedK